MRQRSGLRERLTYSNVMVTLLAFVVLGGGAYAAGHLGKNSVGAKQLKKNAVTAAKIKKNAVTAAKIKKGSVNGGKVKDASLSGADLKDGSLTGVDVNAPSMPFAQVVHKARGNSTLELTKELQVYPLDSPTYTQAANEDDGYVGAVDVTLPSTCTAPRSVSALLLVDAANPTKVQAQDVGAVGSFTDPTSNTISGRVEIGAGTLDPGRFEPGTAKSHTLTLVLVANCATGGGVTATFAGVDVVGLTS